MPTYSFKSIGKVPSAEEMVDIMLSRTQRKTPTVVRNGWKIHRIRSFYMRKVKFTSQNIVERLKLITDGFPQLDDVHPFYADLMNVLYDRDHYKLALGQINTTRSLIASLGKDYARLLKYGDTLYRCKQLKRAALGRMATMLKKLKASFGYLEEVRKHLTRLPSIDPSTRTLILTGYPNVGKSSFMNKVTRADVEVQPYAFTTKSLYVGHLDYQYLRWQVIDTPGILDHPLEERNTIEMQSITALAHLQCSILYFVDISEQCGYSIEQQLALFESIMPLFVGKPLICIANKIDVVAMSELDAADKALLARFESLSGRAMMPMSGVTEVGLSAVKNLACEALLRKRVESKMGGKRVATVANRLTVSVPVARDAKARGVTIPAAVLAKRAEEDGMDAEEEEVAALPLPADRAERRGKMAKMAAAKLEALGRGGKGFGEVFDPTYPNMKKHYLGQLRCDDWVSDIIPQFMDGKNIADYVDPDIEARLEELEREEEQLVAEFEAQQQQLRDEADSDEELTVEETALLAKVQRKKKIVIAKHQQGKNLNRGKIPRNKGPRKTAGEFKKLLGRKGLGLEANLAEGVGAAGLSGVKRKRSHVDHTATSASEKKATVERARGRTMMRGGVSSYDDDAEGSAAAGGDMEVDGSGAARSGSKTKSARSRSKSRGPGHSRSRSHVPVPEHVANDGYSNKRQKIKAFKLHHQIEKRFKKTTQKGEADRKILDPKPKHLFSGKRRKGTHDWR